MGLGIGRLMARLSRRDTIKSRFLAINAERLVRAREMLTNQQRLFLDLLPLLFHVNHPALPGYISQQVPCGIDHYEPDELTLRRVRRQLAKSFVYHRQRTRGNMINSLFLMGSCGTIAQSDSSDLDIWLCPYSSVDQSERELLRQKADLIAAWADTLHLDVHFFLMDSDEFRRGEREALTVEACGTSQHYLLLDEFYRTGLLLAGRIPLWWLVPPEEEKRYDDYTAALRRRPGFRRDEVIDFGGISQIPAGEFIGAGVWQLYKAIHAPHKSVLKLLLTEVYANEYPAGEPLSIAYKRRVYGGERDFDELDPYLTAYRKLEQYLRGRGETDRLELIRRCFYFKAGLRLSQRRAGDESWRSQLMGELVRDWGWQQEHLVNLDTREKWKVRRVREEHTLLVRELTESYRFLQDFARRSGGQALINSQEMTVLGRKLYAAFERKPGKMEWLNPGIAPDLGEEDLTFSHIDGDVSGWAVYAEHPSPAGFDPRSALKKNESLLALLAWCYCNGLLTDTSRLHVAGRRVPVEEPELHRIAQCLRSALPQHSFMQLQEEHGNFTEPKHPTQILVCANIGSAFKGKGRAASSGQWQLVQNSELIVLNSWGEVLTQRFAGKYATVEAVRQFLQLLPPPVRYQPPQMRFHCFSSANTEAVTRHLEQLARDIMDCFYSGRYPPQTRYVMECADRFFVLQPREHEVAALAANSYSDLIQLLGQPQLDYSPIVLDRHCARNSALAAIAARGEEGRLQVFLHRRDDFADVFVVDTKGALLYSPMLCQDLNALTHSLHRFLQQLPHGEETAPRIDYFLLSQDAGGWTARDHTVPRENNRYHAVQVTEADASGDAGFDIAVRGRRFTHREYRLGLFKAVAREIAGERIDAPFLPCYVTGLTLRNTPADGSPIAELLSCKQTLEEIINTELLSVDLAGVG